MNVEIRTSQNLFEHEFKTFISHEYEFKKYLLKNYKKLKETGLFTNNYLSWSNDYINVFFQFKLINKDICVILLECHKL